MSILSGPASFTAASGSRQHAWRMLRESRSGMAGLLIVALFLLIALAAWFGWLGQDWSRITGGRWDPPGSGHWLGTNVLGQDVFDRAVYSTLTAFHVGLVVSLLSTLIGAALGALAGWFSHTWLDETILWLKGVLDSIPFYLFVAAVAFALKGNPWAMHIAMIATFWTGTGRLVRGEVMRLREREFIASARAIGLPGLLILVRHVVPNTVHLLLVQATLVFVAAIKTEVILSFLGLGVQDGVSWGLMLAESTQEVLAGQFGNFIAASGFLFLLLMGFNMLADVLQDAFDARETAQ
ncbi:MAG: ABC transporter permease subunit [Xanthomonadales bacterium]|nr:ABC transporter permease [Xanthomonadales bacterium]NIX12033.1 ABC transporter permease subunit [Xanthomonadales bacterium]